MHWLSTTEVPMYRNATLAFAAAVAIAACSDATAPRSEALPRTTGAPPLAAASSDVTHVNEQYVINNYYQVNPCNGELILFTDARYHVNGTITQTANGFDSKLHLNTEDFQGVGLTTGLQYLYHQQTHQENDVTFNPFTQRFEVAVSYSVISQGSTDNFMADLAYSFTYPPGTFVITRDDARCTG